MFSGWPVTRPPGVEHVIVLPAGITPRLLIFAVAELQAVVRCTPLYQGVVIVRAADLGIFSWALLGHIAYLVVMAIGGVKITRRRLGKLLLP